MKLFPLKCERCGKIVYRDRRRINESKKFGWKTFCSFKCQSLFKNKQKLLKCANPSCNNTFERKLSGISSSLSFCSRSCAASVNNYKYPKRITVKKNCKFCNKEFKGNAIFCSRKCKDKNQIISKKKILTAIQEFFNKEGRIPTKQEFSYSKTARFRFGSWNKAILAAGFSPNPVMFAKKYTANDGHKCDSFAEFIIDNWLFKNKISHQIHVHYPKSPMSSDFLINNTRLEFVGLEGQIRKYDQLLKIKRGLIKKQNLKVIEIYPRDLFPKNNLNKILKSIL